MCHGHLSYFFFIFFFIYIKNGLTKIGQKGLGWRVCRQRGLPSLVFNTTPSTGQAAPGGRVRLLPGLPAAGDAGGDQEHVLPRLRQLHAARMAAR